MNIHRAPHAPGVCAECNLPLDPLRREAATEARARLQKSLFTCSLCKLPTPGRRLPPAIAHHRGRSWSTDPDQTTGVAVFYNPLTDQVTFTSWQTPFLEGQSLAITRRELLKLMGG